MIYVEETDFNRQIDLLSLLSISNDCEICAWVYPESEAATIAGYPVVENSLGKSSVTTYEDGHAPKSTQLVKSDSQSISVFSSSKVELKRNCDSLSLYKNNESSWYVATIGHEGMCLVRDDSQLTNLIKAGFNASVEAPSWW